LFLIFYFSGYFLPFAWRGTIGYGNRYILSQFIPFMFTILYGVQTLLRSPQTQSAERSIVRRTSRGGREVDADGRSGALLVFNMTVLLLVVVDIYFVLTERAGTMYGGE
jgi:hypothetical protein